MNSRHVSVRLINGRIDRVDALIPWFSTKYKTVTRSDVLRALIDNALPRFEAEANQKPGEADQKPGNEEGRIGEDSPELGAGPEGESIR